MDKEIYFRVHELEEALKTLINAVESTTYESGGDYYPDDSTNPIISKKKLLEVKKALGK